MKKKFLVTLILLSKVVADTSLGTPINSLESEASALNNTRLKPSSPSLEKIIIEPLRPKMKIKSYSKNVENPPIQKQSYKKDHHRYDKRYRNFDYERDGYYNQDEYYYGYYDHSGYFYNNIFFTYDNRYTYYDRYHQTGYFRRSRHHHRPYQDHHINSWNRVHCYSEPNQIIDDRYYYYPERHDQHYQPTRMHTNRNSRPREREEHHYRESNHRSNHRMRRSDRRMRTPNRSHSHRSR